MPCACNGGTVSDPAGPKQEPRFEVRLPNGRTEVVTGEHAAKVAVTMAGGGTYTMVR